jgi:hypothetical protein
VAAEAAGSEVFGCWARLSGFSSGLTARIVTDLSRLSASSSGRSGLHRRRTRRGESALRALPNTGGQFLDVIEDLTSFSHFREDLALRVHDCGVVAAECLSDLW